MGVDPGLLVEMAQQSGTAVEYQRAALEQLDHWIGADVLMFVRKQGPSDHARGFDPAVRERCARRWPRYELEHRDFSRAVLEPHGVGVDVDYFGSARLERLDYYQDIMRPHDGRSTLIGSLVLGGRRLGAIVLGRCSPRFLDVEQARLKQLLPALSVCEAALRSPASKRSALVAAPVPLTPREQEVLSYLELGYTNAEIALACGTAPRTVRNQLSHIFVKLGASTRAEAVALSLQRR